ncbi:MAG: glycosyltransferase [Helicobacteraceae bacterium]|nr:glycosyltransferase [Helicobacteraceae bacterium]
MSQPIVSFCIATYNRAERVYALVTSILSCEREDIEVCVNDNASTDNTKELLGKIADSRFKYFENENNIGAIRNMLVVITRASGKYAFYCNDRDLIVIENIPKLIAFLSERDFAYVYCGEKTFNEIYNDPADAFANLYCAFKHPTGEIFNTKHLVDAVERHLKVADNRQLQTTFSFIFANIAMSGASAIVPNIYWKPAEESFIVANPSRSGFGADGREWTCRHFLPADMAQMTIFALQHLIDTNTFDNTEIRKIIYWVYKKEAIRVMGFYMDEIKNPIYAFRYNYNIIVDSVFDQFRQYRSFYRIYRSSNLYNYHSALQKFGMLSFNVYMFYWISVRPLKVYLLYKSKIKNFVWRLNLLKHKISLRVFRLFARSAI